ncbi:probable tRNA methyltransferase 9B [Erpetoichthys calabaricus]|uniref:probable tRNA methyltransferase 9B n=1 Tax=Erpetoichthys calabaricus TaxID=27687 RepID=UPI0010A017A4|nr:probable tRNA methyltransferase 9B [Erpetoichthys calabaricus]
MRDRRNRMENEAIHLEKKHVHSVYEKTAPYLSDLRCKAWPRVRQFLLDQEPGSLIADIGCGTGKYLDVNGQIYNLGCDYCSPLAEVARKNGHEVLVCDNLCLPFRDQIFNAVISIGVIHHFSMKERRIRAIREMARTMVPGGLIMIYVWALEQKHRRFEKQDVFVPWNKALCSRNNSTSSENSNKNSPGYIDLPPMLYSKDYRMDDNLRQENTAKRSYSAGNYVSVGRCCLKIPEEHENKFYSSFGKSLRSWFFSKSFDESSLKKHMERVRPLKNSDGWVENTVLVQPSRHCSIDLGHTGSLLNGQVYEDDDVFVETTNKEESLSIKNEQYMPTILGANNLNSVSNRIFLRTSTLDSTDSFLDAINADAEPLVNTKDFMRYYHVFRDGELSQLIEENVAELSIVSSCFDHGNWCVIARKIT